MYKELPPFSESTDIMDSTLFFFWDTLFWKHVAAAAPLHTPVCDPAEPFKKRPFILNNSKYPLIPAMFQETLEHAKGLALALI